MPGDAWAEYEPGQVGDCAVLDSSLRWSWNAIGSYLFQSSKIRYNNGTNNRNFIKFLDQTQHSYAYRYFLKNCWFVLYLHVDVSVKIWLKTFNKA